MGLGDLFKAKQNEELRAKVAELESMLTPEMRDSLALKSQIEAQRRELEALQQQSQREAQTQQQAADQHLRTLQDLEQRIAQAKVDLVETNETVLMQSFGLYTPRYDFSNATGYKDELAKIRQKQKDLIKAGKAATGFNNWTVNGDARKGQKMVSDLQKLLIRAFNSECDDIIDHVKFNNLDAAKKRIDTSCSMISKLGAICGIEISRAYLDLKIQELHLAYEYQIAKQKERDRLKELRAEERERAKLEKELEAERKKLEKEAKHYSNALHQVDQQIALASPDELPALMEKKAELEAQLADVGKAREQVDYRAANQRAGYVYIISNIGAFGEGVYKIGMTRRLEPMDRIDELGDASVPFDFDVHALIFSEDAPALEAALHRAFEDRKLNMVNTRREFFRVSLEEIKQVVLENYDKTVEFVDIPPAEQFRQSALMHKQK